MLCACGNAARYINELGELCCGICPLKQGLDSIKLGDVPQLLSWARIMLGYLTGRNEHIPAGDSIKAVLGQRPARPGQGKCACYRSGWGGHSDPDCENLKVATPVASTTKVMGVSIDQLVEDQLYETFVPTSADGAIIGEPLAQRLKDQGR